MDIVKRLYAWVATKDKCILNITIGFNIKVSKLYGFNDCLR